MLEVIRALHALGHPDFCDEICDVPEEVVRYYSGGPNDEGSLAQRLLDGVIIDDDPTLKTMHLIATSDLSTPQQTDHEDFGAGNPEIAGEEAPIIFDDVFWGPLDGGESGDSSAANSYLAEVKKLLVPSKAGTV
jgi:hypothetical protein